MNSSVNKCDVAVFFATIPTEFAKKNIDEQKATNTCFFAPDFVVTNAIRQKEIDNLSSPLSKNQKYYVWQLLCYALKQTFDNKVSQKDLTKNADGKWICPYCHLSLSHSGLVVAVALSSEPVGIDVQKVRSITPKLTQRILTQDQVEQYQTLSNTEQQKYVISNWCKRESIFKAVGGNLLSKQLLDTNLITTEKTFDYLNEEYVLSVAYSKGKKVVFCDYITKN